MFVFKICHFVCFLNSSVLPC